MKNTLSLGFSFIEVLISLALLSFIFIGLEGVGLYALRSERESWFSASTINEIQGMVERLQTMTSDNDLSTKVAEWNQEIAAVLPNGKGTVTGHYPAYMIHIYWGKNQVCEQKIIL